MIHSRIYFSCPLKKLLVLSLDCVSFRLYMSLRIPRVRNSHFPFRRLFVFSFSFRKAHAAFVTVA